MNNEIKDRLQLLFLERAKINSEIDDILGGIPKIKIETEEEAEKPKKRRGRVPGSKNKIKNNEEGSGQKKCPKCGKKVNMLFKGLCRHCFMEERKAKKENNLDRLFNYHCLECDHKWSGKGDPSYPLTREKCPKCKSAMVSW